MACSAPGPFEVIGVALLFISGLAAIWLVTWVIMQRIIK